MVHSDMILVDEDVVISGIGGYFPQSLNFEEFAKNLLDNKDLIEDRWKEGDKGIPNKLGVVPKEYFDNAYFGIHRQQCTYMDPMQRLVLERTFEALIDAGVNPAEVRGRRIGVYMASCIGESDNLFLESIVSGFGIVGHSRAMMSNRVSYWLNLNGPSVAYNSSWIGGMEMLRLAYEAIKTGQCEAAIVGTASAALNIELQWIYNDMGLLSPDCVTRAFDADANGYARSDGVVVFYLQKASAARRSYASIVNVGAIFDGTGEGNILNVTVPNMVNFLKDFYKNSPVKPEDIQFVETYGSGNKDIDEKELEALDQIYGKNRRNPLPIGSVKTNAGNSEASSVMFSIAKVLVAMQYNIIPANLHFKNPNPNIKCLVEGRMEVVTQNRPWIPKYAAVNALGLTSYYGHIILKANDKRTDTQLLDNIPRLAIASTRTEEGIKQILEKVKTHENESEYLQLMQDLFAKQILGHLYRGYTLVGASETKEEFVYHQGSKNPVWFVYSGMGSQWNGMVSDFMKIPVFAAAINRCHEVLLPKGINLLEVISSSDKTVFNNILNSFIGIAAMQIALTDLLKVLGIVPDGIIGHSVGELGCAYADGCLTAEQMILSAYSRGRASLDVELIPGMMAAIGVGYNAIKDKLPPTIEVACHNGPDSATLSGPKQDMEEYVAKLQQQGTFARLVNVANIAYHSQYIKPAAPFLLKYLKDVIPVQVKRSSKWVSTSNLEENWNTDLAQHSSAEYHTNNLLSSVYFEEGLKHIPKDAILIEIAPHGLLQAILKRSLKSCINIPLTQRGCKSGVEFLLTSIGKMYLNGLDVAVSNLYPKTEYPVSRGTRSLAPVVHWNHSELWRTGFENMLYSTSLRGDIEVTLNSEEFRECVGHQLNESIVLPASFFLNIVYQIVSNIRSGHKQILLENLQFKKIINIPKIGVVPLLVLIEKGSGEFEITSANEIIMTGKITLPQPADKFMDEPVSFEISEKNVTLSGNDVYNEFQHRGHIYSGLFKSIKNLVLTEMGSSAVVQWNNRWILFLESMFQQYFFQAGEKFQDVQVPKFIRKICINLEAVPSEKTDLTVNYEYSTGIISTEGFQISGMESVVLEDHVQNKYIDSVEYVPLTNANYSNLETGICVAIQLLLTNSPQGYLSNVAVIEIESEQPLLKYIENATSQYRQISSVIKTVKEVKEISIAAGDPALVVYNGYISQELVKLLVAFNCFLFVKANKDILSYPEVVSVFEFRLSGANYAVLRKANESDVSVVTVKEDNLSLNDFKRSSVSWVSELYKAVESKKRVFVISSIIPLEGLSNFVQDLQYQPNMNSVRFLFNLDRDSNWNLKDVFRKDLHLSIIKGGIYNSYLPIPLNIKNNLTVYSNMINSVNKTTITYLGINRSDETMNAINQKQDLGILDYTGTTNEGGRVMGVAQFDKEHSKLLHDPVLNWTIPEMYCDEDAITLPYAFVIANYILHIKARLKPGGSVLVHSGCTPVGAAIIAIAVQNGSEIFTTVSNDVQREALKNKFKGLRDYQILDSKSASFEPLIMNATGGKGVDVIVNNLSGNLLVSSLNCIASFGRFVHIGKHNLEDNSIGMYCFLKNVSFYVVDVNNVLQQSKEVKLELKDLIKHQLESFIIIPLWRTLYQPKEVGLMLENLAKSTNIGKAIIKVNNNFPINYLNMKNPNQFICDPRNTYLIHGGTPENWTDMTEWLVFRGAKKIAIATDSRLQQNHINRRLSLLQSYFNCEIIFVPYKGKTRDGAVELLSEIYYLGPIHAVFLLPLAKNAATKLNDVKAVQYIDSALRDIAPRAVLFSFISSAAGTCQKRADSGFATHNIQWLKDLDFGHSLSNLDDIITLQVRNAFINSGKLDETKQESHQVLYKKIAKLIPNSPEILYEQIEEASKDPEIVQIVTEGPMEIRELAPLFILPGLNTDAEIQKLAKHLYLPTFCAVLPTSPWDVKKLAEKYVEKIREIWPHKVFNLVGLSWGGILATEIAKILDKRYNATVYVYYIDSAPSTLQSIVKLLGEGPEMEINLLSRVFNNIDPQVTAKLQTAADWNSRIDILLKSYKNDLVDVNFIKQGLSLLKSRLEDTLKYHPDNDLVNGAIHLIRPNESSEFDNCELTLYYKQLPQIILVPGDHLSIISSRQTADYINETFQLV